MTKHRIVVACVAMYPRYIAAIYSAFNVAWSPAEHLFTWNMEGWGELGKEIDRADLYDNPVSMHSIALHSGSQHYQSHVRTVMESAAWWEMKPCPESVSTAKEKTKNSQSSG